jgi:hypothetical protein
VITPEGLFVAAGLGDGDAVDDGNGVGGVGDVFEPEFVHPRANAVEALSRKNRRRDIGNQSVLRTAYLWTMGALAPKVPKSAERGYGGVPYSRGRREK